MIYLRQSYKIKPPRWGSDLDVRASIFANAERLGINPASIALAMPMWGPGNQKDYSKNFFSITNNGAIFTGSGLLCNGSTQYLVNTTLDQDFFYSDFSLFLFTNVKTITNVAACGFANISIAGMYCNFEEYNDTGKLGYSLGFVANQASSISTQLNSDLGYSWRVRNGIDFVITQGRDKSVTANGSMLTSYKAPGFTIGAKDRTGGTVTDYANAEFKFILLCTGILQDSQTAYLSDNPYFLLARVAPVYYSLPSGGETPTFNPSWALNSNQIIIEGISI